MKLLARPIRHLCEAIEDTLLKYGQIASIAWFEYEVTFLFAGKKLLMVCKSKTGVRTFRVAADKNIYQTLGDFAPRNYFCQDYELVEAIDGILRRRTERIGIRL